MICCGLMPKVVPAPNGFSPTTPTSFLRQLEQAIAAELPGQKEIREDDHRELRVVFEHPAKHLGLFAEIPRWRTLPCCRAFSKT